MEALTQDLSDDQLRVYLELTLLIQLVIQKVAMSPVFSPVLMIKVFPPELTPIFLQDKLLRQSFTDKLNSLSGQAT